MNNRPIDRTKKSNIKCEHCRYADVNKQRDYWFSLHEISKTYWKCKYLNGAGSEE